MGPPGQQTTIPNPMGHCTPCSTLQMQYTTMRRLPHRENGESYSKSSHHAKQEGRNRIYMPPPCQVPIRKCYGCSNLMKFTCRLQPKAPGLIFVYTYHAALYLKCIAMTSDPCSGSDLLPNLIIQEVAYAKVQSTAINM